MASGTMAAGLNVTLHWIATAESSWVGGAQALCGMYAEELYQVSGLDLRTASFQSFSDEVARLPGPYAPSVGGVLYLAEADGDPVGLVGYKTLAPGVAEMKRLFVARSHRKSGLGRALCHTVMKAARLAGHTTMKLDTLSCLSAAVRLYRTLGFAETEPYCANTRDDAMFFAIALDEAATPATLPVVPDPTESNAVRLFLPLYAAAKPEARALAFPVDRAAAWPASHASFTYGEVYRRVLGYARGLQARVGIQADDSVLILVRPDVEMLFFVLGVVMAGASVVVVDPRLGVRVTLKWIAKLRPSLVVAPLWLYSVIGVTKFVLFPGVRAGLFTGPDWTCGLSRLPPASWFLTSLESVAEAGAAAVDAGDDDVVVSSTNSAAGSAGSELAFTVFTSGSTGPAKPVAITHGMIVSQRGSLAAMFPVSGSDTVIEHNFAFILLDLTLGFETVVLNMAYGSRMFVAEYPPEQLAQVVDDVRPTHVFASYALMANYVRWLVSRGATLPPSVHTCLTFGAPIPLSLHRLFDEVVDGDENATLYTPYGATEALPIASVRGGHRTILSPAFADRMVNGYGVPVGHASPGLQIAVRSGLVPHTAAGPLEWDETRDTEPGVYGEVWVSGPSVSDRYIGNAAATAAGKVTGPSGVVWHRTGDLGYFDDDGVLWYGGRVVDALAVGATATVPAVAVETVATSVDRVFRAAAVLSENGTPQLVLELEEGTKLADATAIVDAVLSALEAATQIPSGMFGPATCRAVPRGSIPVDRRHNSKIVRAQVRRDLV